MSKSVILDRKFSTELRPKAPFNFNGTVYNPGHFPTPTEEFEDGKWWQTFNFGEKILGLRIENKGTVSKPRVRLTIFSRPDFPRDYKQKLISEIEWRFELGRDLSEFTNQFKNDRILGPIIKKWKGMRNKCGYSLYESLIIYIVLQNTTVRRTVQMMKNLLENYGSKVKFDKKEFYTFWEPERLTQILERELRNLKVGYRAKFLKKISESFAKGKFNEYKLRELNNEELKERLIQLYGIGPASVGYLLFEVFHRWDVFDYISPWEQKIYSKLLFNKDLVPAQKILEYVKRKWGKYEMLAAFYIFTDLFWRRKYKKIDWLEKLIRL